MEYHVYWSLKCSYFALLGDEKYGVFWAKKLMERWYLLITTELSCFKLSGDGKHGL